MALVSANGGNACLLAGAGGLNFAGSALINAINCSLASNKTGPNSITFDGNKATVSNGLLIAEGGCSKCGNSSGYLTYQPPTSNPYAAIYNMSTGAGMTMPNFSGSHCTPIPTVGSSTTLTPWSAAAPNAYCGSNGNNAGSTLSTSNGNVLNFVPGTYFFQDAALTFNGGTVNCVGCTPGGAGVTIILTGTNASKIGSISVGGNATVNLNAPATNGWCHSAGSGCSPATAFDGVLFYMDRSLIRPTAMGTPPSSSAATVTSI